MWLTLLKTEWLKTFSFCFAVEMTSPAGSYHAVVSSDLCFSLYSFAGSWVCSHHKLPQSCPFCIRHILNLLRIDLSASKVWIQMKYESKYFTFYFCSQTLRAEISPSDQSWSTVKTLTWQFGLGLSTLIKGCSW